MNNNLARDVYWLLLAIWTAIFAGFWGIVFLGGAALEWFLTSVLGAQNQPVETMIHVMQTVTAGGLALIWGMGAFALFIIRRVLWASFKGPGQPYDRVDLVNDGMVVDSTARDTTEHRS